jgi:hypothetical protein
MNLNPLLGNLDRILDRVRHRKAIPKELARTGG